MQKTTYIVWLLWLIAGIVLKILGLVSWWAAASALWLPAGVGISGALIVYGIAYIGARLKIRAEKKIPRECGNCLFGQTSDAINKSRGEGEELEKCIGEKLDNIKRGKVCRFYERAR
jgi:uncharacterized membrane protein YhiD involved in acid resistance